MIELFKAFLMLQKIRYKIIWSQQNVNIDFYFRCVLFILLYMCFLNYLNQILQKIKKTTFKN